MPKQVALEVSFINSVTVGDSSGFFPGAGCLNCIGLPACWRGRRDGRGFGPGREQEDVKEVALAAFRVPHGFCQCCCDGNIFGSYETVGEFPELVLIA